MSFGARLRALRVAKKMTQKEVSEKTGIALRHYQDLEAGNHKPGVGGLVSLAGLFRVSVDYMLELDIVGGGDEPSSYLSMSDKRPLVFVRTFSDMEEERAEVFRALIEAECICTGLVAMEAMRDEDGRKLAERVIHESDYYFMILSMSDGSYTDDLMQAVRDEFACVANLDRPAAVLTRRPYVEVENPRAMALGEFFRETRPKLAIFDQWRSLDELGKSVCRIALQLRRRRPPIGWIRGNGITREQLQRERDLLERLRELEERAL